MTKGVNKETMILGLMSGTSHDGLDVALCGFTGAKGRYNYSIHKVQTFKYLPDLKKRLLAARHCSAEEYFNLDTYYGTYISQKIKIFLRDCLAAPDAIASHGHTVFHQPQRGFTTQIGSGATIAAKTGITTVCDFRSTDIALGGQGAPLVPLGDKLLFGQYDACLNIGGIANISFEKKGSRIAYDICVANMVLNYLAEKLGKTYDTGGKIAASGAVKQSLLAKLNTLDYYAQKGVKSLGREWFEKNMIPLINKSPLNSQDLLATVTVHIAEIIAASLNAHQLKNVLVTGGGVFNEHLIKTLKTQTKCRIIIPNIETVNFKEALIFAFLAYLRLCNVPNTLASVTGARSNTIGGAVYLGPQQK